MPTCASTPWRGMPSAAACAGSRALTRATCCIAKIALRFWCCVGDRGAASPIHDHGGQRCWAQVASGALWVQTFGLLNPQQGRQTGAGIWVTAMDAGAQLSPGDIDFRGRHAPVHRVSNPHVQGQRAVSVHVYARPLQAFIVYDAPAGVARRQRV